MEGMVKLGFHNRKFTLSPPGPAELKNVRFWPLADIPLDRADVCFWGNSGYRAQP